MNYFNYQDSLIHTIPNLLLQLIFMGFIKVHIDKKNRQTMEQLRQDQELSEINNLVRNNIEKASSESGSKAYRHKSGLVCLYWQVVFGFKSERIIYDRLRIYLLFLLLTNVQAMLSIAFLINFSQFYTGIISYVIVILMQYIQGGLFYLIARAWIEKQGELVVVILTFANLIFIIIINLKQNLNGEWWLMSILGFFIVQCLEYIFTMTTIQKNGTFWKLERNIRLFL